MPRRSVSIQDIARSAGVSHSTVSRALRDSPLISAEVRARIRKLADEMGYTPNAIAQSLQTSRTQTIGLVVSTIADPFWSDVVRGVEQVTRTAGLSLLLSASHRDPEQEIAVVEMFHRRRVDGIVVADSRVNRGALARIARAQVPTVLLNNQAEGESGLLTTISIDDRSGARMAVEHLIAQGHRRIGYLGIGNRPRSNALRRAGYEDALAAAGIAPRPEWAAVAPEEELQLEDDVAAGEALAHTLIAARVSAICCYNDMAAIGVLMACRSLGVDVPGQASVIGFDDVQTARYVTPALTTMRQPRVELGQQATQTLLDLVEGRPTCNHTLLPTLVVRESVGPPPMHGE